MVGKITKCLVLASIILSIIYLIISVIELNLKTSILSLIIIFSYVMILCGLNVEKEK